MLIQLTLLMHLLQKVYATYMESQDIVKSIEEIERIKVIARIKEIARIKVIVDTSFNRCHPCHFDLSKKYFDNDSLLIALDHIRSKYASIITEIKLSNNEITNISNELFLGLDSLVSIDLNRNKIEKIAPESFKGLS